MAGNTTSLYTTTSSTGNVTIPSNNNTGLYNTSASPASSVNNNLNVNNLFASGNIYATGTIQSGGNMSTGGSFTAAGNVTAQNFIGNFAGNISGNVAAAGSNTQVQYNNGGGLGASADLTFDNTTNLLSVTGNVAAGYFLGDGSQLTNLPATYGNANVTTLLASFGSNSISTTGNVTTGYVFGNGSQLTGVVSDYGNANVANYLPIYSGSLDSVNNITASGNVTALKFATSGAQGNIVGPNYVSANYFVGDGSLLTNVTATTTYNNSNVTALMAAFGSNTISTTGNITSGYLFGNGSQLTGLPATYSNANVTTLLANFGSNTISTTGNITAGYVVGNGSLLTNLTGANVTGTVANATFATTAGSATTATSADQANYANIANSVSGGNVSGQVANALVAGTVYTAAQPNITSVGNLSSLTVTGDSLLQGNLQVNGNVTYIASNTVVINDKFINVANNASTASAANGGGIGVGPAGAEYATWSFSDANTAWQSNIKIEAPAVTTTGNVTANYFIGDGSLLTNINAGNIVGAYGNANVSNFLGNGFGSNTISTTGNIAAGYVVGNGSLLTNLTGANVTGSVAQATYANIANSVAGANVTGTVANATYATTAGSATTAGTVTTAAQPNITSVGTLTSLSVSGNVQGGNLRTVGAVSASGNITGSYILGNGSQLTGIVTSTYGNTNVAAFLNNFGSNNIVTDGNITMTSAGAGGYLSVAQTATVGSLVSTTTISGASLSVGGNVTGANLVATGTVSATGNVRSSGMVATGNISASNFIGNGSQLTGTYGNSNVSGYLPYLSAGTQINTTGSITGGNLYTSGDISATGQLTSYLIRSGAPGTTTMSTAGFSTPGTISATGNITTAGNFIGNGSQLTGIVATSSYNNANVNALLAAWGSNTLSTTGTLTGGNITGGNILTGGIVSATGNVQGNYFIGNGSQLTGIAASYGDANVNTLLGAWGSNSLSTAGTVNAGNITGGNILTGGTVSATGGLRSGAVSITTTDGTAGQVLSTYGNGVTYFADAGTGTYGNANVTALMAAFGSNTISTTGNVTSSNLILSGQIYDTTGVLQLNGSGNIVLVPITSTQAYGPVNIIGGKLTADAVTYANADGTAGQVLTTYGNGVTYFSTVSGGSGSPGGANTQLQFNDNGAFAGNTAMTFNTTTGNIGLGNVVINTNQIETVSAANLAAVTTSGQTTPWRILVGDAYNGNVNSAYSSTSAGTIGSSTVAPRLLVSDFVTVPNNGMRFQEHTNYVWANLSANISNTSTRIGTQRNEITVGGGTSNYTITATNTPSMILSTSNQVTLGGGTNANLSLVGNITTTAGAMGSFNGVSVQNYSTANIIVGQQTNLVTNNANTTAFGNATTQIGHFMNFGGAPANANVTGTTTAVAYYMPGFTQVIPGVTATNGNIARQSANYYSFRSDDTLARAQLGSLSSFNEYTANTTSSSGTLTVNKANGQVQQVYTTENITTVAFSGFVTRVQKPDATYVNQSDTVTLIIQQGATPYTVTMPTGTAYRYAGSANTVGATANTTIMISITGTYNYLTAADQYLITISPEFL